LLRFAGNPKPPKGGLLRFAGAPKPPKGGLIRFAGEGIIQVGEGENKYLWAR